MDRQITQTKLEAVYADWRATLHFSSEDANKLSPPLLLNVTENYCRAERRVLLYGQQTFGWTWTSNLQKDYPAYPRPWPFQDIRHCSDFLANSDSIEGLCWAYNEFKFSAHQPDNYNSPFWRAFREVCDWPGAGLMWSNVVRMDYEGGSICEAPPSLRNSLISQQARLVADELAILNPHVCLFFSGPNYDDFIKAVWPGCDPLACSDPSPHQLARMVDPALPAPSFRTYHPKKLRLDRLWHYIEIMRKLTYGDHAS